MQGDLQKVLDLQPAWSSENTNDMRDRGELVRTAVPSWLEAQSADICAASGIPPERLLIHGRDGTGLKTRVPWTRFSDRYWSERATDGFYVVLLWAFDGSAVFLSLNQGTTNFEGGEFIRKPRPELAARVAWSQNLLGDWLAARDDLAPLQLHDKPGRKSLGEGYELGNIAAVRYDSGAIPDQDHLRADALSFAGALGTLYSALEGTALPYENPEVEAAQASAATAAGKGKKSVGKSAGFRQSKEERDLIEDHAVKVAKAYYAADGWSVKVKGAPYDLALKRDDEALTIEVKGTTSLGEQIVLTDGEVRHHKKAYPNNGLVVVRGIDLDRSTTPPTVSGGELFEQRPWNIAADALRTISYKYGVPDSLYGNDDGFPADDLLT